MITEAHFDIMWCQHCGLLRHCDKAIRYQTHDEHGNGPYIPFYRRSCARCGASIESVCDGRRMSCRPDGAGRCGFHGGGQIIDPGPCRHMITEGPKLETALQETLAQHSSQPYFISARITSVGGMGMALGIELRIDHAKAPKMPDDTHTPNGTMVRIMKLDRPAEARQSP